MALSDSPELGDNNEQEIRINSYIDKLKDGDKITVKCSKDNFTPDGNGDFEFNSDEYKNAKHTEEFTVDFNYDDDEHTLGVLTFNDDEKLYYILPENLKSVIVIPPKYKELIAKSKDQHDKIAKQNIDINAVSTSVLGVNFSDKFANLFEKNQKEFKWNGSFNGLKDTLNKRKKVFSKKIGELELQTPTNPKNKKIITQLKEKITFINTVLDNIDILKSQVKFEKENRIKITDPDDVNGKIDDIADKIDAINDSFDDKESDLLEIMKNKKKSKKNIDLALRRLSVLRRKHKLQNDYLEEKKVDLQKIGKEKNRLKYFNDSKKFYKNPGKYITLKNIKIDKNGDIIITNDEIKNNPYISNIYIKNYLKLNFSKKSLSLAYNKRKQGRILDKISYKMIDSEAELIRQRSISKRLAIRNDIMTKFFASIDMAAVSQLMNEFHIDPKLWDFHSPAGLSKIKKDFENLKLCTTDSSVCSTLFKELSKTHVSALRLKSVKTPNGVKSVDIYSKPERFFTKHQQYEKKYAKLNYDYDFGDTDFRDAFLNFTVLKESLMFSSDMKKAADMNLETASSSFVENLAHDTGDFAKSAIKEFQNGDYGKLANRLGPILIGGVAITFLIKKFLWNGKQNEVKRWLVLGGLVGAGAYWGIPYLKKLHNKTNAYVAKKTGYDSGFRWDIEDLSSSSTLGILSQPDEVDEKTVALSSPLSVKQLMIEDTKDNKPAGFINPMPFGNKFTKHFDIAGHYPKELFNDPLTNEQKRYKKVGVNLYKILQNVKFQYGQHIANDKNMPSFEEFMQRPSNKNITLMDLTAEIANMILIKESEEKVKKIIRKHENTQESLNKKFKGICDSYHIDHKAFISFVESFFWKPGKDIDFNSPEFKNAKFDKTLFKSEFEKNFPSGKKGIAKFTRFSLWSYKVHKELATHRQILKNLKASRIAFSQNKIN